MQVKTLTSRPESEAPRQFNGSPAATVRQADRTATALCILGTDFHPERGPSPRMLSRMLHASGWVAGSRARMDVIASGGIRGTGGAAVTEAQLIDRWFQQRQFNPLLCENYAVETVGNLAFTYLGILQALGDDHVVFVTDSCHTPRTNKLAQHILKGLVEVSVSPSPWPLSLSEADHESRSELAGMPFIERLLNEVRPGRPEEALKWVSANHRAHPYAALDIDEVVFTLRSQVLSYKQFADDIGMPFTDGTSVSPAC